MPALDSLETPSKPDEGSKTFDKKSPLFLGEDLELITNALDREKPEKCEELAFDSELVEGKAGLLDQTEYTIKYLPEPTPEELIDNLRCPVGFPEASSTQAKWKLKLRLRSHFSRGGTMISFLERELSSFQRWQKGVMSDDVAVDFSDERFRENIPELVYLAYVWYLIYSSMGNMKTLWCFRCFLFYETVKLRNKVPIGKWVIEQVSAWYEILRQNSNKKKEQRATMDKFLNYDDVNQLFYCREFIDSWLDDSKREDTLGDALIGAKYKTYLERSNKSLVGVVSWLSFYRNYYFLIFGYTVHLIMVLLLTTNWWDVKLIVGAGLVVGGYLLKLFADWYLKPSDNPFIKNIKRPDDLCFGPNDAKAKQERKLGWLVFGGLFAAKTLINVFVFYLTEDVSPALYKRGTIHVLGLWGFVIWGYLLDTLFFYNIHLAIMGYHFGKKRGVGRVKTWEQMQSLFKNAKKEFYKKVLYAKGLREVAPLPKQQRRVAWALFWNQSLYHLHNEDLISKKEFEIYSYTIAEDVSPQLLFDSSNTGNSNNNGNGNKNFLSGLVVKEPDLSVAPVNRLAKDRMQEIVKTMYMDMPVPRPVEELPAITTLIPVYNETVIYSVDDIARPLNTGKTVLAFMIYKYPDEWNNFLERMKIPDSAEIVDVVNSLIDGSFFGANQNMVQANLSPEASEIVFQVRLWVSNRFQALSRTVRGIMYRFEAYKFLLRLQNPEMSQEQADKICSEKFQLLVAYQTYANLKLDNPLDAAKKDDLMYLMRCYPQLDIAYILNEGGLFYGVRMNKGETADKLWLPGFPILCEGKPENQVCALAFAWGDYIQALDMNQDGYFEEEIKFPNLLQEFERDEWVKIVGFPERVTTRDFNSIGYMHAFSERTFTTCVNRMMSIYGVRQHYGHPDVFDGNWVETEGGMSKQLYVSEDIFGGYEVAVKGYRNQHVDYIQEAKGKEVGVLTTTKFFTKTSAGGAQQLYSRWIYFLNSSHNFPLIKRFHHFFLALGYYFEHTSLKYALAYFVFTRVIFAFDFVGEYTSTGGTDMFSSANLLLGVWVLQLGYLMAAAGFAEMILERGWRGMVNYLKWFWPLLFFYIFHILTNASGFGDGILSRAKYIPTGRTFMLEHVPFRNIYTAFKGSHLYFTFILVFMMFAWIYFIGVQTWAVLWTILLCVLVWFSFPFMMNPGALPLGVNARLWFLLLFDDWVDYFKFSRKVLLYSNHLMWPAFFVVLVSVLTFVAFPLKVWWALLLAGICIGLLTPWLRIFYFVIGGIAITFQTFIGLCMLGPVLLYRSVNYLRLHAIAPWLYGEEKFELVKTTEQIQQKELKKKRRKKIVMAPEKPRKKSDKDHKITIPITLSALPTTTATPGTQEEDVEEEDSDERSVVQDESEYEEEGDEARRNASHIDNTFTLLGASRRRVRLPLAVENAFSFDRAETPFVPAPRRRKPWENSRVVGSSVPNVHAINPQNATTAASQSSTLVRRPVGAPLNYRDLAADHRVRRFDSFSKLRNVVGQAQRKQKDAILRQHALQSVSLLHLGEFGNQQPSQNNTPRVHYSEDPSPRAAQAQQHLEVPAQPQQQSSQQHPASLSPASPRLRQIQKAAATPNSPRLTLRRQIIQQQIANEMKRQPQNASGSHSAIANRSIHNRSALHVEQPPDEIEGLLPRYVGSHIGKAGGSYIRNATNTNTSRMSGNAPSSAMSVSLASSRNVDAIMEDDPSFEFDEDEMEDIFVDDEEELEEYASDNEADEIEVSDFDDYDEEVSYY